MLAWVCKCHLPHQHKATQCTRCGEHRWEALARMREQREREEARQRREPAELEPELIAKLEAVYERWKAADCR